MTRRTFASLVALAALAGSAPASAGTIPRPASAPSRPAPERIRFSAAPGETLLVHGTYPRVSSSCVGDPEQPLLHERYRGAVEVRRASDGSLYLIGELAFEDYLKGIAEVPRDWPMEALKAQVVAARSYALSQLDPGGDYDLCATDACQVYLGAGIELGAWGHRWTQAVEETAGEVLLHGGKPAVTFYSSTSPGRTFPNEKVFGGEPLPYLRGGIERDDGASPVSRWTVRIPYPDLARFLAADGRWSGRRIRRVSVDDGLITLRARKGRTVLDKGGLRDAMNDWAPCLAPGRYPATEPDGDRLPQAVPSVWFRARPAGRTVVLEGRGWGHGVGMVQWGAYGKARRGLSYDEILAAYYGGLRPQPYPVPATIRVLLATGLTSVTVVPSGEASLQAPREPRPPWRLTGGRRLRLLHGSAPLPLLQASGFTAPPRTRAGRRTHAHVDLSHAARVRLEFLEDGSVSATTPWLSVEEGRARIRLPVPELAPGRYVVRAVASDGVDTVRTAGERIKVSGAAPPPPSPSPTPAPASPRAQQPPTRIRSSPAGRVIAVGVGAALASLVAVFALLRARRRKGLHRS